MPRNTVIARWIAVIVGLILIIWGASTDATWMIVIGIILMAGGSLLPDIAEWILSIP